jgi:protein-S-isoprenylcysteine O-methyltransferase Ste14
MSNALQHLAAVLGFALPPYGMAAVIVIFLYALQSEIRFGAKARTHAAGASDRGSTLALSLASAVPILGFVLAMQPPASALASHLPGWLAGPGAMPGMPEVAWLGVGVGCLGIAVRLWAVLTLRQRYTRTLLVHDGHVIERSGPYRFVRHPGYLGSLLCLNGVALASGSAAVFVASAAATFAAYAHRICAEDTMLVAAFGEAYESYRREVNALIPFAGRAR